MSGSLLIWTQRGSSPQQTAELEFCAHRWPKLLSVCSCAAEEVAEGNHPPSYRRAYNCLRFIRLEVYWDRICLKKANMVDLSKQVMVIYKRGLCKTNNFKELMIKIWYFKGILESSSALVALFNRWERLLWSFRNILRASIYQAGNQVVYSLTIPDALS